MPERPDRGGEVAAHLRRAGVDVARQPHPADRLDRPREVGRRQPAAPAVLGDDQRVRLPRADARVDDDGQPAAAAVRHPHDVARPEPLERLRRGDPALARALPGQLGLAVLDRLAQPRVVDGVAEVAGHRLAVALERLEVAGDLAGQPDDALVRLELRERALQQRPGRLATDRADEVDGHVVAGPEAAAERVGAGAREAGELARVEALLPQHDGVALDVDAASPGASGQLGVLPGLDVGVGLAVPLDQLLQHHAAGRHVDAEGERLGGEDRLHQAHREQLLDDLLEGRQHAGVVGGDPALEGVEPLPVAQHPQVLVRQLAGAVLDVQPDPLALLRGVEPQPGLHALLHGRRAAGTAEDEGDRRQQAVAAEPLDDVGPARDRTAAGAAAVLGPEAGLLAVQPLQVAVDLAVARPARSSPPGSNRSYSRVPTMTCWVSGTGRCSSTTTSVSPRTVTSQSANSSALLTVADSDTRTTSSGQVDDHLFPDAAAGPVGEVVHLVHDHVRQPAQRVAARRRACCAGPRWS